MKTTHYVTDKTNICLKDYAMHSKDKCATDTMKNKIQRDLSLWLKLLGKVSGQHMVYLLQV